MLIDDVLTIARCREIVGVSSNSEDAALSSARAAAVGWLGRRVNREILDRTYTTAADRFVHQCKGRGPPRFFFRATDIDESRPIVYYGANSSEDPGPRPTSGTPLTTANARMSVNLHGLTIFELTDSTGRLTADLAGHWRIDHPTPAVRISVGMAAGDIPTEWPEAVGLMVRQLYEGSALDSISETSTLSILLAPWNTVAMNEMEG